MVTKRTMTVMLLAICIALVFASIVAKRFQRTDVSAAPKKLIAPNRQVAVGEMLLPVDLQEVEVTDPKQMPNGFAHVTDLVGRTARTPLSQGAPIQAQQVSAQDTEAGLSPRIPEGMRALSLKSDQVVGVAGFLLPGTRVDVLVTYQTAGVADPVTMTVLQDAPILTAGQKFQPDPEGKPNTAGVITLLVSPEDAERVVLASTQGSLHFVLRNGSDHLQVKSEPMRLPEISKNGQVTNRKVSAPPPPVEKRPAPYSIQIVQGDKSTTETFQ